MLRDRVLTNLCVIKIFQNVIGYIILIDCKKNYILKLLCLGHTKKKKEVRIRMEKMVYDCANNCRQ